MSKSDNLYDFFTDLANAIREKEGSTTKINPQDMAQRIASLGDKVVVKVERTTLRELLYDIAEALRLVENSSALINPQDMSERVLAIIKSYIFNVLEGTIELDQEGSPVSWRVESDTTWAIELNQWDSGGGNLYVTYTGNGNDEPIFSSDPNEGIDREVTVTFEGGGLSIEREVTQEGLRQPITLKGGGVFRVANGGRFGVLKSAIELPYAEELEYLESSGNQYINTGVKVTPDYTIEVTFVMTQRNATWDTLFGTRSNQTARFTARWANSATGKLGVHRSKIKTASYESFDDSNATKTMVTDTWHTIKLAKREYSFDGALRKTFSATTGTTEFPYPIYLFALCNAGSPADYGYFRIKSARMWNSADELIRDFIPVIDKEGKAAMYDKVNGVFYYNKGSGSFKVGYKQ